MTLSEHLALGYDFYVHGSKRRWTRARLVDDLRGDAEIAVAAQTKLAELNNTIASGRQCFVSTIQQRILRDGIEAAATNA